MIERMEGFEQAIAAIDNEELVVVRPPVEVEFEDDELLIVADEQGYRLPKRIKGEMFKEFGVSAKFVQSVEDKDVQSSLLNYCLDHAGKFELLSRGGEANRISFGPPLVTHKDVLVTLQKTLPSNSKLWAGFDKDNMYECRCVTPDIAATPKHDDRDESYGGLVVHTNGYLRMGSYIWRLVCSNGMRALTKDTFNIQGNNRDEVLRRLGNRIPNTLKRVEEQNLPMFVHTAEIPIEDAMKIIEFFAAKFNIPFAVREEVAQRVPSEGATFYDLVNAFTELARDKETSTGKPQKKLERIAMQLLNRKVLEQCQACGAVK